MMNLKYENQLVKTEDGTNKRFYDEIIKNGKPLSQIMEDLNLGHISDESILSDIIAQVLSEEGKAAEDAKQNPEIVNFLVGKVMQRTHGKADPELTLTLLKKNLGIEL